MFEWLNHNAAAVQALAAVCTVIATVALLRITSQYVGLTQELARAAREQLRFQRRTVESETAQLMTMIDVFLGGLKRFPVTGSGGEAIRSVSLWKHADVSTFGSLAASVLGRRPDVQRAIQRLNWLYSTADRVQQSDPDDASPSTRVSVGRVGAADRRGARRSADRPQRRASQRHPGRSRLGPELANDSTIGMAPIAFGFTKGAFVAESCRTSCRSAVYCCHSHLRRQQPRFC